MLGKILKHPLIILLAVGIGIVLGINNLAISKALGVENIAASLGIAGELFIFFLQMTVFPIIITAISSSVAKLVRNRKAVGSVGGMIVIFLATIVAVAVVGMALGAIGQPGAGLNEQTRTTLGSMIAGNGDKSSNALEMSLSGQLELPVAQSPGLVSFVRQIIPQNIFSSLTMGQTMAIVFFSILFGVAAGSLKEGPSQTLVNLLSAIFEAFQKLIAWSLYALPLGLICLMADQISRVGPEIFLAMSKFIFLFYIGTAIIFLGATIIIWLRSGIANPLKVIRPLFEPMVIAFATRNSMSALPSAIKSLDAGMGFDSTSVNLTLPLGMTIGRYGNIFYFALVSFFVTQVYGVNLEPSQYLLILVGVIFAGTATAGASGIVTLSLVSIVLNPIGLPVEAILVILMAIDAIIDPGRTFLIVYCNTMASALMAPRKRPGTASTITAVLPVADRKPFHYLDANGDLQGLEVDLIREAARRLGLHVEFIRQDDPLAQGGDADIIGGRLVREELTASPGYVPSTVYVQAASAGRKRGLCFLLAEHSVHALAMDETIKTLKEEHFVNKRLGAST